MYLYFSVSKVGASTHFLEACRNNYDGGNITYCDNRSVLQEWKQKQLLRYCCLGLQETARHRDAKMGRISITELDSFRLFKLSKISSKQAVPLYVCTPSVTSCIYNSLVKCH